MIGNSLRKIIRQRSYLLVAIGILLVTLITMGSAYLENTLSIVGNTKMEKNSWVIYFDDVEKAEDSVNAVREADIIDFKKTKIEFEVNLDQPGDLYEFTVWTVNDGTVDAMVDSIEKYELTDAQKEYLEFDVRYDTGEEIKHCDPLYHLGSDLGPNKRLIKAIVRFKDGVDLNKYPKENQTLRLFFNINYVQLDNICTPPASKNYHKLTIRPNGGIYEGRTAERRIYLEAGQEYTMQDIIRKLYNFDGWEMLPSEEVTYTFDGKVFTMGDEDAVVIANWKQGDYVARIMETYYPTIQAAFDDVSTQEWEDNTVWLLRDTTEYPTNNSRDAFAFDLDGHTVTGTITNSVIGNITLLNGKVIAEEDHDEAFINNGTLKLGIHDGTVEVDNSIALIGNSIGLNNVKGSKFYFYDGYIEGVAGIVGGYTGKENGYYVFVNHNNSKNCQKVYLVKNPNRAVVKTLTQGEMYYYNAQDAINSIIQNKEMDDELGDDDYIMYAIRDFEAAYTLTVPEDARIFFDLIGFDVQFGELLTNEGLFHMVNSAENVITLRPSMSIINKGDMKIDNINITMTTDSVGIDNTGDLDLSKTHITAQRNYAVKNTQEGSVKFDNRTYLEAVSDYGLYNSSPNLVINHGYIRGFVNEDNSGNVEISGDVQIGTHSYRYDNNTHLVRSVYNKGTVKQTGGEIIPSNDFSAVVNIGTYNYYDGVLRSDYTTVYQYDNWTTGTLNVYSNTIYGTNTVVDRGVVNVRGGNIVSENDHALYQTDLYLYSGRVETTNGVTQEYGNVYIYGGELVGGTNGPASGIDTFYIEGGKVTSETTGISAGSAIIKGGLVDINDTAINTSGLNMSGGKVVSRTQTGIVVNGDGLITGGEVYGDLYGVHSKSDMTVGIDDDDIISTSPVLQGGSYGLYIGGSITNFYDGIFKGQVDGYNETTGRITGTPLGGTIGEGQETIDGDLYETDFVVRYKNWLRVNGEDFNTVNAASEACEEEQDCTITVISDAYTTYEQSFLDENDNKNITFDLNGHTISGTQAIYNFSTVTIVDSSSAKTGTVEPDRVPQIVNANKMTIKEGKFLGSKADAAIYNRQGEMTIDGGYFYSTTSCIENAAPLHINDILVEGPNLGIDNTSYVVGYTTISSGSIVMDGGIIRSTDTGISAGSGSITINDGLVESNNAIAGNCGSVYVTGGKVHSKTGKGILNYWGSINVSGGEVIADNDTGVQTSDDINISGGYVKGTIGAEHTIMCSGYYCWWNDINISGGKIEATETHGVIAHGASMTITGGQIYGEVDGVESLGSNDGYIGRDDGSISTSSPLIQGKRYGYYTDHYEGSYTSFFDGILKGKVKAHEGLIGLIPDSATIKDDYEYINREEYKTQYLVTYNDWLRVGDHTYNSLTDAVLAIEDVGTIYVIADAYVGFSQGLPYEKEITFDLNGHQLITTQPLYLNGINTIRDSVGGGKIYNLRDNVIINRGTSKINSGTFISDTDYAIVNDGDLTINDATINTYGAIQNYRDLTINGGTFNGTNTHTLYNDSGTTTINGGTFTKESGSTINGDDGWVRIHGGTITNNSDVAVEVNDGYGTSLNLEVTSGNITGVTKGIYMHSGGQLQVKGGNTKATNGTGIYTSTSYAYITGGVIEGTTYGVLTRGTTTIGDNDGTITIDVPMIKGDTYGLYIEDGTLNFYDGILKGITNANYGQITNIPNRAQIYIDSEVIDGENYETKYLITETDLAKNLNTGVLYSNLQDALNEAHENETVQLLTNVPLYYSIVNNNSEAFTLDMNGYTISTNKAITNSGNLTIKNTSDKESFIKTSSAITLITNTNTLYFDNINVTNTSSDKYVIYNAGNMNFKDSKINALSGIQNVNNLTVKNSNITTSGSSIYNAGELKVDRGTYSGSYSLYNDSNRASEVKNATFDGHFYNNKGSIETNNITITKSWDKEVNNYGYIHFYESSVTGDGFIRNSGNMFIENSTVDQTGSYRWDSGITGVINSGTMTITNSEIHLDEDESPRNEDYGISNSGTLTVNEKSLIQVGLSETTTGTRVGIYTSGNGNTTIDDSTIRVRGGSTSHGIYVASDNSHVTILTGEVRVTDSKNAYGAYINLGTFTMGHNENLGIESEDVSKENPVVYSSGVTKGIGVKKINGKFQFYDGIIWGSRYSKPETTTDVEKNYEVTTYVDKNTGYEYAWLEWMGEDYQGNTTVFFHNVYYPKIQDAIDVYMGLALPNEEIKLLKSVAENVHIPNDVNAILNLNGHSVTGTITNDGTLQVFNGSLQNFGRASEEEELTSTVINNGTFIIGQDDGNVSSTNVRVVNEDIAITNNGTVKMYDGYLEGNPSIIGEVDEIAQYARIHTVNEPQYERKYLQSLSRESIINRQTALILTIDPNGGYYKGNEKVQNEYLLYGDTYDLVEPTKDEWSAKNFVRWEVSDPSAYDNGVITIDIQDLTATAIWEIDENAVARIGEDYYYSVTSALDRAKDGETITILKDTEEDITVRKEIIIDLNGHTITGAFINNGILTLKNGTVYNPNGTGLVNLKSLTLGELDENVDMDNVKIRGTSLGLQQEGRFNFYDGYIEGEISMIGTTNTVPKGFSLYTEHNEEHNTQGLFLSGNPENAVASITDGAVTQFYFKLTDAIASAKVYNKEVKIERDFEATYEIEVKEDYDVVINMNSHDITTGNIITVNGKLLLYDNSDISGSITSAKSITNNGNLTIQGIKLHQNKSVETLINNGTLVVKDNTNPDTGVVTPAIIESTDKSAVVNNGDLTLTGDYQLNSNSYYALEQKGTINTLTSGTIVGILPYADMTLGEGVTVTSANSDRAAIALQATSNVTIDGATITAHNIAIYTYWSNTTTTVNSGTITGNECFYYENGSGNNIIFNDGNCTAENAGFNIRATNTTTTLNGGRVQGKNYGYYANADSDKFIMNGGTLYAVTYDGFRDDRNNGSDSSKYEFHGGLVSGARYGIRKSSTLLEIDHTKVETRSTSRDDYALNLSWAETYLNEGTEIIAEHASGIWIEDNLYINDDAYIYAGAGNAYGIAARWLNNFRMTGGKIYTPGRNSLGIYVYEDVFNAYISGGEIISGNVGINMTNGYGGRNLNITGGKIFGDTYGINQTSGQVTTNLGSEEDELSTSIPYVTGGLYGIYKSGGLLNFYNGRVRGKTNGYYGELYNVRTEMDVTTINESVDVPETYTTYSTDNVSETATRDHAKIGDGYARFTYVGEDTGICDNGQTYDFTYKGEEEMFIAPCSGKYTIEVWGAQGGRALCDNETCGTGGYGAYSYGEITLSAGENLYVNVGGRGDNGQKNRCASGGYNGGGSGTNDGKTCSSPNDDEAAGGGGGATHIATKSGLLSSLENNKNTIIMVAGGGGGAAWSRVAGSGGGYTGGTTTYSTYNAADQTSGYAFGQGENAVNPGQPSRCDVGSYGSCNGVAGGGGGYYGGYTSPYEDNDSGTGGSGYIGNSRLSNAHMTGYDVPATNYAWKVNFLIERENFLMVGDKQFNNFTKAAKAVTDEDKTIYLLKNVELHEDSVLPEGKNAIFDLNGFNYVSTKTLKNEGTLKIINSSDENPDAYIESSSADTITNTGNLTLDGVIIKNSDTDQTAVYGTTNAGTITVKNSKISGYNGIIGNVIDTITYENSTIDATNCGIVVRSNPSTINYISGTITAGGHAIRLEKSNNTLTVTNGTITGSHGIYSRGDGNVITIDNGTISGTNGSGLYMPDSVSTSNLQRVNINHGKITGTIHGIEAKYSNIYVNNDSEVYTSSTNRDHYAIVTSDWNTVFVNDDAFINAPHASGIYSNGGVNISGGRVYAGADNAYGIYGDYIGSKISGGTIEVPETSSYGIYLSNADSDQSITITGGIITSGNQGISMNNTHGRTRSLTITGGTITGDSIGISINQNYSVVIGDKSADIADETPIISGGRYAIDKYNGTLKYYSGLLKGYHPLDESIFDEIKDDTQLHTDVNVLNNEIINNTNITINKAKNAISNYAKEGDGYARITYLGPDGNNNVISDGDYEEVSTITCAASEGKVYNFYSIRDIQTFVTDCDGEYKLEVWGAQGGYRSNSSMGGKGGYSSGTINLKNKDTLLVYVGSQGNNGGWNGGGTRSIGHNGGGATDIRLTESIYSRIIVAGGGGSDGAPHYGGGYAGGTAGGNNLGGCGSGGIGATQTGTGDYRASFGQGGSGAEGSGGYGGAGGGGWYGGGGANPDHSADDDKGGGGGSGFVYNADAVIPSGYLVDEKYKLTDTKLLGGNQTIPNYETGYDQVGNVGDGFARITFTKASGGNNNTNATHDIMLDTSIGYLDQDVYEYNTGDVLGELPEPILEDDNYIFDGWYLDEEFTQKVNSNTVVKSSARLYAKFKYNVNQCESLVGEQFNYDFQKSYQSFKAYCPGEYKLEVWGAQGGKSLCDGTLCGYPGFGGYSSGNISLGLNERLYITTGGSGNNGNQVSCAQGGYNGGGKGTNDSGTCNQASDDDAAGGGGGATHISRMPGLLKDFEDKKNQVLIVAGGGGGSSWYNSAGSGGGYFGGRTLYTNQTMPSQTEGSAFGYGQDGSGQGASVGVAGAGGGWYGGYVNNNEKITSATGGSGYVSSELTNGVMYHYQIDTTDVLFVNSLVDRDGFIEVVGVNQFNNFDKAFAAIESTGTIKLLKDIIMSESITIPAGKEITLDLNGYTFTTNKSIINNGKLTVTNGTIVNNSSTVIENKGDLIIDGVSIKNVNYDVILGTAEGSVIINSGNLSGKNIVNTSANQTITINGGTLVATNVGIYTSANNSSITINGGFINGGEYGIRTNGLSDILTINDGTVQGGIAIYDNKSKDNNTRTTFNILGGTIESASNGIYSVWNNVNIENTNIINKSTGYDNYGLQCRTRSICTLNTGTRISSQTSSGIYVYDNATLIINDVYINAGNDSGRGIYEDTNSTVTINNGTILTPGLSANGLLINQGNANTTINDVYIESGNVGVNISNSNSTKNLYLNSGSIFGKTYGIYQTISNATTVIGDSSKDNSTTNPSIEGGLYGIYSTGGTISYYSGVLKGYNGAYYGDINNIRENHDVFEDENTINELLLGDRTYSTENTSTEPTSKYAKEGDGYARITYSRADSITDEREVEIIANSKNNASCSKLVGKEYTFSSIGEAQTFVSECAGEYKLEVWGAQGGYRSDSSMGGKGGYSTGTINLEANDTLYVYVGAAGNNGGFNGGGTREIGHGGGGATDIRYDESLYSRIIVAGGGGSDGGVQYGGGYGGGTAGGNNLGGCGSGGTGASQTGSGDKRAGFGYGGNGAQGSGGYAGAGGGGWYGGGGADPDHSADDDKGGGGGSGFVYTADAILPSGYMFNQKYLLSKADVKAGNERFSSYDGTNEVYGNVGDGFAKITFVKSTNSSTYNVNLVTYVGTIENTSISYRSGQELGTIPAPTITADNLEFDGWYLDKDFTKKPASTYRVRSNLTLYARFNVNDDYCSSLINETYNYTYTGSEQTYINICPGKYKLETWGAQGGNASYNEHSYRGGYGGYSSADITLSPYEVLYINVGGQGESIDYQQSSGSLVYDEKTGYNGGGRASSYTNNSAHAGGGGATHIATKSGLLKSLSGMKEDLLIVAGGGGGASTHNAAPSYSGNGGSGGGYTGGDGITGNNTCYNYGTGGTQANGGTYTACQDDGTTSRSDAPAGPGFGYGSNYSNHGTSRGYSGGGGGYYGGQSGYHAPGGGGSGYNGNSRTSNNEMYGYQVTPKYDNTNTKIAYLVEAKVFIKNTTTNREYSNLQDAIDEVQEEETIQLTDNNAVSYSITIPQTKNFTLDLNGHNLKTTKTITNNGYLNIINSDYEEHDSKISSSVNMNLFTNNSTINSDHVNYSGYTIFRGNSNSKVDIKNANVTAYSHAFYQANKLTMENVNIEVTSNSNVTYQVLKLAIKNSILSNKNAVAIYSSDIDAEVGILESSITSENVAVQTSGKLEINSSTITGGAYALNIGSNTQTITNSTLKGGSYAIYTGYSGNANITINNDGKEMVGNIYSRSNVVMKINKGTIKGGISNEGNLTINTVTIQNNISQWDHYSNISNSGVLNIHDSTINTNDNYHSGTDRDTRNIANSGTLTSDNNIYTVSNGESYRYKYLVGIYNTGILTSTNDKFNLNSGRAGAAIYNSTSNTASVTNVEATITNVNTAYGFINVGSGTMDVSTGTVVISDVANATGIRASAGTVTTTAVDYTVNATTAHGAYVDTGDMTIVSGDFTITGTTAYGAQVNTGTLTLGVEGNGVSTTSPYFIATGSTTGYGISNINGTFKYYDGKLMANTAYKAPGDIITTVEDKYEAREHTYTDEETGIEYKYCVLESIFL